MGRIPRLLIKNEPTVYHVMSRTALPGYPLEDIEKDYLFNLIKRLSGIYYAEVLGICVMSNHFHLLTRIHPSFTYSDEEVIKRFKLYYGENRELASAQIPFYREKWSNLSEFIKEVKQTFSKFYNKRHDRTGFFWNERFKSLIVENGNTLVNCLAYIDLNPIRARIVKKPEAYRWSSIGYHTQTDNADDFLSTDFGVIEFGVDDKKERFRLYRQFVYETGAVETVKGAAIDRKIVKREKNKQFELSRADRFKYRTRYFSDSRIIGSKSFVLDVYGLFKDYFQSSDNRKANAVMGLQGIFSLKRLQE